MKERESQNFRRPLRGDEKGPCVASPSLDNELR